MLHLVGDFGRARGFRIDTHSGGDKLGAKIRQAQLEKVPFTERVRHGNMLELLRHAGVEHASRVAIRFLSGTTLADPVRDVRFDELLQRVIQTANLLWISRGTFTSYTSEVKDLAGLPAFRPPLSGFGGLGVTFIEVGQPLTQIIGHVFFDDGAPTSPGIFPD